MAVGLYDTVISGSERKNRLFLPSLLLILNVTGTGDQKDNKRSILQNISEALMQYTEA